MPIYAYRCTACGHANDVLQKMSDPVLTECPACGAATFTKQVTAAGFQLKGSGWYATDFRGGSAAKPEAAEGQEAASAVKGDDKAAAKPAADGAAAAPAPAAPAPAKSEATGKAAKAAAPAAPAPAPGTGS